MFSLPEQLKIINATAGPVTSNGGVTCDYVSLKNVIRAWIVASFAPAGAGHATVVQPRKATTVAGAGAANVTSSYRGWRNSDISTSDTLTALTAATSFACDAGQTNQLIVVEIDPALEFKESYDVLGCTISNSAQANNYVDVLYVLETNYQQATPPAAITD